MSRLRWSDLCLVGRTFLSDKRVLAATTFSSKSRLSLEAGLYQGMSLDVPHLVLEDKEASFSEARISVGVPQGAKAQIFSAVAGTSKDVP